MGGSPRAMVLEAPAPAAAGPLRALTREPRDPGPGQILLRVAACGVCRTDLQLCEGDLEMRARPIVPGHQIVGRVEAVGTGVVGWRADFALRIPDGFDDLAAAPLLCGGVIGYRSLKRSAVEPGGRLGLYGFGASALITLQIARHWGCRIFVATRSAAEQEHARSLGAEWAGGYGDRPPESLDAAITFAPSGDVVRAALRAVDRGATVAINAIHLDRLPEMPYEELWWERRLASVANFTRADAREFLDLAARIPIRTTFETHPLEHANVALARLAAGEVRGAAVLVP